MKSKYNHKILLIGAVSFILQLLTGTDVLVAINLSTALTLGLLSAILAGGITSAFGILIIGLTFRCVGGAILVKTIIWEGTDVNLQSPVETSTVMLLGFLGVFVGMYAFKKTAPIFPQTIFPKVFSNNYMLALTLALMLLGYVPHLLNIHSTVLSQLETLKAVAIFTALEYISRRKCKKYLSHPFVLSIVMVQLAYGVVSTSKQEVLTPLVIYGIGAIGRYGWKYKPMWIGGAFAMFLFGAIIYPYAQYIRSHGGRVGSLSERAELAIDVMGTVLTDPTFLDDLNKARVIKNKQAKFKVMPYLGYDFESLGRIAMIGEADRLIYSSIIYDDYSGWETIIHGVKFMTPGFILPNKPKYGSGNYLGHVTRELGENDTITQVSFGYMANLFNAFSYTGVFFGSIIISFSLFYWLRHFCGLPDGYCLWTLILFVSYNHTIVEGSIAGQMGGLRQPIVIAIIFICAYFIEKLLLVPILQHGRSGAQTFNHLEERL